MRLAVGLICLLFCCACGNAAKRGPTMSYGEAKEKCKMVKKPNESISECARRLTN